MNSVSNKAGAESRLDNQSISNAVMAGSLPSVENSDITKVEGRPQQGWSQPNPRTLLISKAAMPDSLPSVENSNLSKVEAAFVGEGAELIDPLSFAAQTLSGEFSAPPLS